MLLPWVVAKFRTTPPFGHPSLLRRGVFIPLLVQEGCPKGGVVPATIHYPLGTAFLFQSCFPFPFPCSCVAPFSSTSGKERSSTCRRPSFSAAFRGLTPPSASMANSPPRR